MIDWERVTELREEVGAEEFAEVVDLFLDEVETTLARLGEAPGQLEDELHFLKGSAWNLGFREVGALCQDGERQCAAGRGGSVEIGAVRDSYARSKQAFMARAAEFLSRPEAQIRNSASASSSVMSR